jgi:hypothetical protein
VLELCVIWVVVVLLLLMLLLMLGRLQNRPNAAATASFDNGLPNSHVIKLLQGAPDVLALL